MLILYDHTSAASSVALRKEISISLYEMSVKSINYLKLAFACIGVNSLTDAAAAISSSAR